MTPEALAIETMFNVVDKEGNDLPFMLNETQRQIDNTMTGRDLIPKARQRGVSMYFLARYTAACLIQRNVNAVIVSHETDSTQRLLNRCHYFINNMRGPNPEVGRSGINIIQFPKTNSQIYIGTAGSRKFGRGDTITHLLCSEYAYWPRPNELLSGLLDSVPSTGEVAIESTGNGSGNDYHRRCLRAAQGQSQWMCHFYSWLDAPEYRTPLTANQAQRVMRSLNDDWEEPELVKNYNLDAEQIMWRRGKLEEKDYDVRLFKQEYPLTLDECFQSAQDGMFYKVNFQEHSSWKNHGDHLHMLKPHPIRGFRYVLGADPAGGSGGDNSCIEIFCLNTNEQVAEYANNRIEPDVFGSKIIDLAVMFNNAYCVVESNNHGPVALAAMRGREYPEHLIYSMENAVANGYEDRSLMQMGFRTSSRTKPIMIGKLRTALSHEWTIHSELLKGELSTFIEHEDGTMAAQDGCHDDRVMASACAMMGVSNAEMYAQEPQRYSHGRAVENPFMFNSIIKELTNGRTNAIMRPQNFGALRRSDG